MKTKQVLSTGALFRYRSNSDNLDPKRKPQLHQREDPKGKRRKEKTSLKMVPRGASCAVRLCWRLGVQNARTKQYGPIAIKMKTETENWLFPLLGRFAQIVVLSFLAFIAWKIFFERPPLGDRVLPYWYVFDWKIDDVAYRMLADVGAEPEHDFDDGR